MNARLSDPDRAVELLVELAQRSLTDEAPRRDAATFAAPVQSETNQRLRWGIAGAGALALAATTAFFVGGSGTEPLTVQVIDGEVAPGGAVEAATGDTRLHFSDGSEIRLREGARARVAELSAHGSDVRLERGVLGVRVVPRPRTEWSVQAGPYEVQVTGTAFDVSWNAPERAFALELREGSVTVVGPQAKEGVKVVAGQRLSARPGEGFVLTPLTQPEPGLAPARPELERVAPAPPSAQPPATASTEPELGAADGRARGAWSRELSRGNFAAVIADAERRGLESVFGSASLEELGALADAARYARRFDVARRALLATRERFATSGRAREAAFFLGRIAEEQGDVAGALGWYDRYLARDGKGAYLAQALGRKMVIVNRQSGADAARPLALEYRARYPKGDYAATARKLAERDAER